MHQAAAGGQCKVILLLLGRQAQVDALDSSDIQPVHLASFEGHTAAIKLLLERKAFPDARRGTSGGQPTHLAAYKGHCDALSLLLRNSAAVTAKDSLGFDPLYYAAKGDHHD